MTKTEQQRLAEYEAAEKAGYIKRCPKCGSLKITAYVDEVYFSDMQRFSCVCGYSKGESGYEVDEDEEDYDNEESEGDEE